MKIGFPLFFLQRGRYGNQAIFWVPNPNCLTHTALLVGQVEAGSVLRGSATRWLLGRPLGTWASRQGVRDAWMVPGQYLHKAQRWDMESHFWARCKKNGWLRALGFLTVL